MPTFYTRDLDIDVDEFLDDCSSREITEAIDWLKRNDYLAGEIANSNTRTAEDEIFADMILQIIDKRFVMTTEDELALINIVKKYI